MELKLANRKRHEEEYTGSNRTFMELKLLAVALLGR